MMTTYSIRHPLAAGVAVPEEELWTFPEGLIGFPEMRRFALVELQQARPFRLLASLDEPAFGLVVVDPRAIVPDYELALGGEELAPLGTTDPEDLTVAVSVVLPTEDSPFALNLRAPIVMCGTHRRGVQRASADEGHAVRYVPESSGTGAPTCSS